MNLKHLSVILSAVCCFSICHITAAELKLASNGQTDYAIRRPSKPSKLEKEAVADFISIMKKITGADFAPAGGKTRSIYVGTIPPNDKKPLQEGERRITSYKGDIYIYGNGDRGNTNAVYDFLREFLDAAGINRTGYGAFLKRVPYTLFLQDQLI